MGFFWLRSLIQLRLIALQHLAEDKGSCKFDDFSLGVISRLRSKNQDWIHILSDPDRKELERMISVGEAVTWPKVRVKLLPLKRLISRIVEAAYD